ncbi:MAG TPA: RNA polymerase sigma factor [Solirubrobacteraceae bacterium]|nr:RNA polymerase sigma factor [Solirubrobacteraceae bacterium]
MTPFRPRHQHELERLDDDALIAYMREAGAAGHESAALALAILVYGQRHNVRRRVLMKVPSQDVDDVTDEILAKAIVSAFDGTSGGQFGSWLNTITKRAIADYHRRGPGRLETDPLEERDLEAPQEHAVEALDALERVLATLSDEHRRVVELWLQGFAAPEIEGVSDANVHQIVSRFRRALRGQLGDDPKGEAA